MLNSLTGLSALLVLFSSLSATLSVFIQRGNMPQWSVAISAMVPALIWSFMSRLQGHSLVKMSILYDIIAISVWNVVFALWGEAFTGKQILALGLHLAAILLVV